MVTQRIFLAVVLVSGACGASACSRAPKTNVPTAVTNADATGGVSVGKARELLQRLLGANWQPTQVELKSISNGVGGDNAVVEARIETAYRFGKVNGDWQVAEIRLGDQQWESLELVETAVHHEKERRTTALLQRFAQGLQAYQKDKGQFVESDNLATVLDYLVPRYLGETIRVDLWGTPLRYRGTSASFQLLSPGADRKVGTPDDLVLENGTMK